VVKIRRAALALACGAAATLVGVVATATAADTSTSATRQAVTITAEDGTPLAATLLLPPGTPPAGGWPGVVFLHGLGDRKEVVLPVAEAMGLADRYAVLAYDARGHGQSGGTIGIDGPREVADARSAFDWLRSRSDVSDTRVGGWGVSYGGGALLRSLTLGTPWAALEVVQTWTDLRTALAPQDLVKSGAVVGFLGLLPPERVDPEVLAIRDAAFAGNTAAIAPWAAARSSLPALKGVTTPIYFMQGRRDFAFGLDQVTSAWPRLAGPKRLWIGLHGHAPSTFPAADTPAMLADGVRWFDQHLRGVGTVEAARPVTIAPERGQPVRLAGLPKVVSTTTALPGTRAIALGGKVQRTTRPLARATEVFGAPVVRVRATASGGWSRLVAVLSARTPAGKEIVVAGGGVPTRPGARTYAIRLGDQATVVPKGSRLTVTLASSSTAQSPGNLLYVDLPMALGARITIGPATLRLPALARPVTR
jgi:predicted acyl esterase